MHRIHPTDPRDRERLRDEVRRLEQAEQYAEALQAIRDSGLVPTDPEGLREDIARLKQAARLHASYLCALAALEVGDPGASALLAAVVAVDPTYKDAARLLYETVSGASVGGLRAEIVAAQEAARRSEAQRAHLARGRARLAWVAGAQGVVLCFVLGWTALRRAPAPAAVRTGGLAAPNGEPQAVRPLLGGGPEPVASPVAAASIEQVASVADLAGKGRAQVAAASPAPGASPVSATPPVNEEPQELDGPCRSTGERCWSSAQCCFGSMCYGTTCQDTRRTIVFGQYRP